MGAAMLLKSIDDPRSNLDRARRRELLDYAKSNNMGMYASTKSQSDEKQDNQKGDSIKKNQEQSEKGVKESEKNVNEKASEESGQTSVGSQSENKDLKGWVFLAVLVIILLIYFIKKTG